VDAGKKATRGACNRKRTSLGESERRLPGVDRGRDGYKQSLRQRSKREETVSAKKNSEIEEVSRHGPLNSRDDNVCIPDDRFTTRADSTPRRNLRFSRFARPCPRISRERLESQIARWPYQGDRPKKVVVNAAHRITRFWAPTLLWLLIKGTSVAPGTSDGGSRLISP